MIGRLRGAAAALLLGLAVVGIAPAAVVPNAQAATCTGSTGVSVVVDNRELGGGIVTGCVPDGGGKSAAAIFAAAGVQLTYATRQPGFVCRVGGIPASDPCVNASPSDAYWGLWWANGTSPWTYSSSGVGGLTVPDGGSVAWSWQQDRAAGQAVPPGVPAPVTRSASPSPSPTPTTTAPAGGSTGGSTGGGATSGGASGGSGTPGGATSGGGSGAGSGTASGPGTAPGPGSGGAGSAGSGNEPQSGAGSDGPSASPSASASETASTGPAAGQRRGGGGSTTSPDADPSSAASASGTGGDDQPGAPSTGDIDPGAEPAASTDQPEGIPAWLTWSVFGAMLLALVAGALISRRRARA